MIRTHMRAPVMGGKYPYAPASHAIATHHEQESARQEAIMSNSQPSHEEPTPKPAKDKSHITNTPDFQT